MENKQQMIHIASEVVVLLGLTFYFNKKNKKIMEHIEDLAQRIEEQEDLLQKHEQVIKKLVNFINAQQTVSYNVPSRKENSKNQKNSSIHQMAGVSPEKVSVNLHSRKPVLHKKAPLVLSPESELKSVKVSFDHMPPKEHKIEEVFSEEEENSDLDAELAEELKELHSDEEEDDLKKS